MKDYQVLLQIARDELNTIIDYTNLYEESEDKEGIEAPLNEIRGDEFNHALIAMLLAAKIMGISIATDDITPDPNSVEVT